MTDISLRADCAQCAALCCVALAFDRSHLFAIDKAAGEACPNLSARDRCSIHARREQGGFAGCVRFDCLGAGQRVTAMFAGQSWRDGAKTARAMFDAFSAMRRVHEMLLLLREAEKLPLLGAHRERCGELTEQLAGDWTAERQPCFGVAEASREVAAFLAGLRGCVVR